jgi:hypothetical protein
MRIKFIILIASLFVVVLVFIISLIIRAKRKMGIKNFLQKNEITYDTLLVAHESQHYIAVKDEAAQFHLLKYSQKKKAFQLKTFHFNDFEMADFYLDGRKVFSINRETKADLTVSFKPNPLERNLVSVRLYIKGIQYPYILNIDQFAEGNGSSLSDNNLMKNVDLWQTTFFNLCQK